MSTPSIFTCKVLVRHSADCPKTDPQWRRCNCRKSLYIYDHGKVRYKSAKTRSWEAAERAVQAERDLRDPIKIAEREMASQREADVAARKSNQVTIEDALNRWLNSQKQVADSTGAAYRVVKRKISDWAAMKGITRLRDVTPEMLDEWRGKWSPAARREDDRMGNTTQSHFQTRLKSFFGWAAKIRIIDIDPSVPLGAIAPSKRRTMPLTPEQFKELLAACELYDAGRRPTQEKFGNDLRVLFQVMRWSGLRIGDALMLPRSALTGNRLSLVTQKTKAEATPVLPDPVVEEIQAYKPRPGTHPDYYWWTRQSDHLTLTTLWTARIRELNPYLAFKDEKGQPMPFHSHMLRDTFAVELLLAGVPLEDVSRLLTHKSVRVTERYYAPWVRARRDQLEEKLVGAMRKMGVTVGGK
ncbi:MAG TPA: tyrosine-type recombinase/integrase [Terracidiphilus sp.]|jgi:site-specific recombinase XerD